MRNLFSGCKSLKKIDLSNFITDNTFGMCDMFKDCESLTHLDLSKFNTQNVQYLSSFFDGGNSLKRENLKTNDDKILEIISN